MEKWEQYLTPDFARQIETRLFRFPSNGNYPVREKEVTEVILVVKLIFAALDSRCEVDD